MKRSWNVAFVACATVLATAAMAAGQEEVRGYFEGPVEGANAGTGAIGVTGWAVADSGVRRVIITVDGLDIGEALYGRTRPQVSAQNPGFPDSAEPGFGYFVNSTDFPNGEHEVGARIETEAGTHVDLPPVTVRFTNTTHLLYPFGRINRPARNAVLGGSCEDGPTRYSVIEGWALDLGVEIGDAGVGWVELLIDGAIISNTRTGCFYNPLFGGLTNCYGLPRLDIERAYPFAIDAPNAGYRFVLDVGDLIQYRGFAPGHHTLTIRVGDIATSNANIDEIPVTFQCIEDLPNQPAFGRIENPRPIRNYGGVIEARGWALDWEVVTQVQVYIDGDFYGNADYGVDNRPGVLADYPGYPNADLPGWSIDIDTTELPDGHRQMQVFVRDVFLERTHIGEVSFFVDNQEGGGSPVDE